LGGEGGGEYHAIHDGTCQRDRRVDPPLTEPEREGVVGGTEFSGEGA